MTIGTSNTSATVGPPIVGQPAPPNRLTLVGIENGVTFTAQSNPDEIRVDKAVPWTKASTATGDQPELQFHSGEGRTMTFELLVDTSEAGTDVHAVYVAKLLSLAMAMDPDGPEDKKRPPRVRLSGMGALKFEGVVESIAVD
jgi:hypothetical protein